MAGQRTKTVKCPTCGQPARWADDNAFRPFCSERCKLIDLGAWAAERYAVAGAPLDPMEASTQDGAAPGESPKN